MLFHPATALGPSDPYAHYTAFDPQTLVDLHVHTTVSGCGYTTPERLVRAALAAGVRVLTVTDHDSAAGGVLAREIARELAGDHLLIIPGMELSVRDVGHVLVFGRGVEEDWGWRAGNEQPVLPAHWAAVLAHPLRDLARRPDPAAPVTEGTDDGLDLLVSVPRHPPERIDAVEAINGGDLFNRFAHRAAGMRALVATLIAGWALPAVGGSDGHSLAWTGSIRTQFARPVCSIDELVAQLRAGHVLPAPLPREALAAARGRADLHQLLKAHVEGRDLAPVAVARGWSREAAHEVAEQATAVSRLAAHLRVRNGVLDKLAAALGVSPTRAHVYLALLDELDEQASWRRRERAVGSKG